MEKCSEAVLGLRDYELIANKILGRHFSKYLHDPDVLNTAISAIIKADIKFNGRGNIHGFRSYLVKKEVGRLIRTPRTILMPVESLINKIAKEPSDLFEEVDDILCSRSAEIIRRRFQDNEKIATIADAMSMSPRSVVYSIESALSVLRRAL